MASAKTLIRFLEAVVLDLMALPGKLMSKEGNARWHLKYVCPMCSNHRKKFRDPEEKAACMWEIVWKFGDFDFPRDYGLFNHARYYLGIKTHLENYAAQFSIAIPEREISDSEEN